jgi:hypothetical protein
MYLESNNYFQKNVEKRRTSLYKEIDQLFKDHEGRDHLVLEHRVFVNAMDKNDPEIENLKKIITELTFNHPSWGERMPNAWIPLELEIAELTAEGKQILSLKDIEELNNASEVSTLSSKDLKTFLQIQHSLGKIVYFDTPQLKDYVVISPLYMVEVMKSFVTGTVYLMNYNNNILGNTPYTSILQDGKLEILHYRYTITIIRETHQVLVFAIIKKNHSLHKNSTTCNR